MIDQGSFGRAKLAWSAVFWLTWFLQRCIITLFVLLVANAALTLFGYCLISLCIPFKTMTDAVGGLRKVCKKRGMHNVLQAVQVMHQEGIPVSRDIIYGLLQQLTRKGDLTAARWVYSLMIENGVDSIAFLGDHLIRLFALCGSLEDAKQVFCKVAQRSVYTWHAIIEAHSKLGEGQRALELYRKMQQEGIKPDRYVFTCCLNACASAGEIQQGRLIQDDVIKSGLEFDVSTGSSLIDMYAKCKSIQEALKTFDSLPFKDAVSWGAMISAYSQLGQCLLGLDYFGKMQHEGIEPSKVTFLCILKACSSIKAIAYGRMIHGQVIRSGLKSDIMIGNTLVNMYAKCGDLDEAKKVFSELSARDIVSWCAMITGYVEQGHGQRALESFEKMLQEGLKPDKVTRLCILKACTSIGALQQGRLIHSQIIQSGLKSDVVLANALVDLYAKCGSLREAMKVFYDLSNRNVVSYGAMIAGYAQHGHTLQAFQIYEKMKQEGMKPTEITYLCILRACKNIQAGRLIHEDIIRNGLQSDEAIGNTLTDMYIKCGCLDEASKVFDKLPNRTMVSWGVMITGYAENGDGLQALKLFEKMGKEGIQPAKVAFLGILRACGSTGAIAQGKLIHEQIIRSGLELDVAIGSSLVDMYAKCGILVEARELFDKLPNRDINAWGTMIAGYAACGSCILLEQCLEDMECQGLKPNNQIFTSILTAYSHAGLLDKGHASFQYMRDYHSVEVGIEHYSCIIDLLGRAGCLNEAANLLCTMPLQPSIIVWTSLLSSCRTYGDIDLGRWCFDQVVRLGPNDASGYVLMSNIYSDASRWEDIGKIQEQRRHAGAWKKPGMAWIEVDNKVHEFIVGGALDAQDDQIDCKLQRLKRLMMWQGQLPQLKQLSKDDREVTSYMQCEIQAMLSKSESTAFFTLKSPPAYVDSHDSGKILFSIVMYEIDACYNCSFSNDLYLHKDNDNVLFCVLTRRNVWKYPSFLMFFPCNIFLVLIEQS